MFKLLKHEGFSRLLGGLSISMVGDSLMLLVLSMWVKDLTGSNSLAGMTFFFVLAPALAAPFLGVLVDRLPRRPVLVWGHVLGAVAMLPLLAVSSAHDVWIIWSVGVCYGLSFVIHPAALNGVIKDLLPEDMLTSANASIQTIREGLRLGGPLAGATLYATMGGWAVALINAATFLIAALLIMGVAAGQQAPARSKSTVLQETQAGLTFLAGEAVLKHATFGMALMLGTMGMAEVAVFAALDAFNKPTEFIAIAVTCQGIGALVGALSCPRLSQRFGNVAMLAVGMFGVSAGMFSVAVAPTVPWLLTAAALVGVFVPVVFINFSTLVQKRTPSEVIGRVTASTEVLMTTPQAVSIAAGAALVSFMPYWAVFAAIGATTLLGAVHITYWLREHLPAGIKDQDTVSL